MSHTKGPWKIFDCGANMFSIETSNGNHVTGIVDGLYNAYLIAAAPDLLEAAEEVLKYVDPANDAGQQPLLRLADAVRRAKGELK